MKRWIFLLTLVVSQPIYAVDCYITFMKGTCFEKFNVTLKVHNNTTHEKIMNDITLPITSGNDMKNFWVRLPFNCKKEEAIRLVSTFTPTIWDDQKPQDYQGNRIWTLPAEVKKLLD